MAKFKMGPAELADRLGIKVSTLKTWELNGKLEPHKTATGGRRYYLEPDYYTGLKLLNPDRLESDQDRINLMSATRTYISMATETELAAVKEKLLAKREELTNATK